MDQNNHNQTRSENVDNDVNNGYRDYLTGYKDYDDYNEETAAEIYAPVSAQRETNEDIDKNEQSGKGFGYVALALSILSLFVTSAPVLFGAAGLVLGFIARNRGATGLGNWAIGLGALSVVISLFLIPFFY